MDKDAVKQLQSTQLDILMEIDSLCKELKLTYYLMFGSLIGAIRHQGPIPWDADIDIVMLREDYEKFREYCVRHNDGEYFYSDYLTDANHHSPHALLIKKSTHIQYRITQNYNLKYDGIYVDIFPLDRTTSDKTLQQKQAKKIMHYNSLLYLKQAKIFLGKTGFLKKCAKKLISIVLMPISLKSIGRKISKEQQRYEDCDADCYVIPTDDTCFNRIVPLSYYVPNRTTAFSNKDVSIPAKAEEILTQRYGEYMKYPPEAERWNFFDDAIVNVIYE